VLLDQTKKKSASRAQLVTQLLEEVKPRIDHIEQESMATAKKATEIIQALQLEMQCVFKSTDEALKTYHSCQVCWSHGISTVVDLFSLRCTQPVKAEYAKAEEKFDKTQAKGQAASKKGEKVVSSSVILPRTYDVAEEGKAY
jgi:hypothetical protein